MQQPLNIQIRTLTPLWTGGINGTCDRLHISGLMGSLRYWYEAIVRGTGGYACDPSQGGCIYDPNRGEKSICAACYLFGTTGWARLFRLSAMVNREPGVIMAQEPLHFRAEGPNQNWLKTTFEAIDKKDEGGKRPKIQQQQTIFSPHPISLRYVWRGIDSEYGKAQMQMLWWFLAAYAGLGAKQQFGFGQIQIVVPALTEDDWLRGLQTLKKRKDGFLQKGSKEKPEPSAQPVYKGERVPPPDLHDFFHIQCSIAQKQINQRISLGNEPAHMHGEQSPSYLANAFDLRYKGKGHIGLRRFLDARNKSSSYAHKWGHAQLNAFMGASKLGRDAEELKNDQRSSSRLFVSMPYAVHTSSPLYSLRMYGFALPQMLVPGGKLTAQKAAEVCQEYLRSLGAEDVRIILGSTLLEKEAQA